MNGKGGMGNEEFECYIYNSIVPLFPDLEDMPRKCILLKVGSGRGWNWRNLLNKCWFRGVYIYPGLPNSTSMQQEMDINFYGPFKGVDRRNLAKIAMCVFLASGYGWVTVMHEIPISSAQLIEIPSIL